MRCLTEAAGSQSSWLVCSIISPGQTLRTAGLSTGSGETSLTGSLVFRVQCLASPAAAMLERVTQPRGITTGGCQARPG